MAARAATAPARANDFATFTGLETLGTDYSGATGVSADGSVVVGYLGFGGSSTFEAYRYAGGAFTLLATLDGTNPEAFGVSGDGSVVVGSSYLVGNVFSHAFSHTADAIHDLGTLGMTVDLPRDMLIGATVGANFLKTDMTFNGAANMSGGSVGAFVAGVPDAGLQCWSELAARRDGTACWAFNDLLPKTPLTPFAFASLTTSLVPNQHTTYVSRLGVTQAF